MSVNKKYFWIKLKDNFFETEELKILENMTDGYIYSNILLKLYLKSLKNNGKLLLNELIPYNSIMLASVTGHNVGNIEKAIKIFKELSLIDILDNGTLYMVGIENFVGKSSTEADRIRKYRKKLNDNIVLKIDNQKEVYKCTPEIRDKKLDIRDYILDNKINKNNTNSSYCQDDFLKNYLNNINPTASPLEIDKLTSWADDIDTKLINRAIEIAVENNARRYSYINAILNNWSSDNIKTFEQYENLEKIKQQEKDLKNERSNKKCSNGTEKPTADDFKRVIEENQRKARM